MDIDFILRAQQTWSDTYARHRWYESLIDSANSGYNVFNAALFFDQEYNLFVRPQSMEARTTRRNVHPNVRIPLSLVTGPWDEERQKRLLWLVCGGINLETQDNATRSLPWEYHLEFLRTITQAETPNSVVYRLLRDQCDLMRVPEDILRRERDGLVKRLQWGHHTESAFGLLQEVLEDVNYKLDYQSFSNNK